MTKQEEMRKALSLIYMVSLSAEYAEDLMNSSTFSNVFVRQTKKATNEFLRYSDKIINQVCDLSQPEVTEQIVEGSKVLQNLLENRIEWKELEEYVKE